MATRNISLTTYFDDYIDQAIASGRYQNASEVVRAGLRLLEQRQRGWEAHLARLQSAVVVSETAIANGDFEVLASPDDIHSWMDSIWAEIDAEFETSGAEPATTADRLAS